MFYSGAIKIAYAQNLVDVNAVYSESGYRNGEAAQLKGKNAVEV
jgi:hypothetical protein